MDITFQIFQYLNYQMHKKKQWMFGKVWKKPVDRFRKKIA